MKSQLEYLVARMNDQQAAELLEKAGVEFDSPHGKLKVKKGGFVDSKGGDVQLSVGALTGASIGGHAVTEQGGQEVDHGIMLTQVNSGETLQVRRAPGDKTGQVFETVGDVPSHAAANRHRQMQQPAAAGSQNDPKVQEERMAAGKAPENVSRASAPTVVNPDPNRRDTVSK